MSGADGGRVKRVGGRGRAGKGDSELEGGGGGGGGFRGNGEGGGEAERSVSTRSGCGWATMAVQREVHTQDTQYTVLTA